MEDGIKKMDRTEILNEFYGCTSEDDRLERSRHRQIFHRSGKRRL